MRTLVATAALAMAATLVVAGTALAQSKPEFKLGFAALADQIPDVVGEPLEDERWGDNGDSLQRTSKGLMVWRKADNWTAFTNGSRTWINGPQGVKDRSNDERFEWEAADPNAKPVAPASASTSQQDFQRALEDQRILEQERLRRQLEQEDRLRRQLEDQRILEQDRRRQQWEQQERERQQRERIPDPVKPPVYQPPVYQPPVYQPPRSFSPTLPGRGW